MDKDKALLLIENTDTDRSLKHRVLNGMKIIARYLPDTEHSFAHDQVWYGDFDESVAKMSPEEVTEMATLGWFEDEEAWSHF